MHGVYGVRVGGFLGNYLESQNDFLPKRLFKTTVECQPVIELRPCEVEQSSARTRQLCSTEEIAYRTFLLGRGGGAVKVKLRVQGVYKVWQHYMKVQELAA